eukprot:1160590-Pelagomonas_calceolata.AAC.3
MEVPRWSAKKQSKVSCAANSKQAPVVGNRAQPGQSSPPSAQQGSPCCANEAALEERRHNAGDADYIPRVKMKALLRRLLGRIGA